MCLHCLDRCNYQLCMCRFLREKKNDCEAKTREVKRKFVNNKTDENTKDFFVYRGLPQYMVESETAKISQRRGKKMALKVL